MVAAAQRKLPDSTNGTGPYDAMDWQRKANAENTHLWEVAANWLVSVAGAPNAITASSDTTQVAAIAAYVRPMAFWLVPANTNTGGVTINIDSVGVANIYQADGASTLQAGDLTDDKLYKIVYDGMNFRLFSASGGSANVPSVAPGMIVREEQSANTSAGDFNAGAFQARILNTSVRNVLAGASLDPITGNVTLQAGTYFAQASAPAFEVGNHLLRLQNITDGTTIETGTSEENATGTAITTRSIVSAVFTITSAKVIQLQHRCQTTKTGSGLGIATNLGAKEVYAWLLIWPVGTLASQVNGVPGGAITFPYLIDTSSTADSNPGAGNLRFNNATQNAATVLRIDLVDANLSDQTATLDNLDISTGANKGYIRLTKYDDPTKWLLFKLTARAAPTGYRNLAVTKISDCGIASPFALSDKAFLEFTQNGDTGPAGGFGVAYTFSTNTAATDPGAGGVKVDNATLSAATHLYISKTDANGNALAAEIATWTSSSSTIKGRLKIFKTGSPGNFVSYDINGALIDNGAWDTIPIGYVTTGGAGVLNNDPNTVVFVPKGDVGSGGHVLLNTLTASNSASLSDTTSLTNTYSAYEIEFINLLPQTSVGFLQLLVHSGGAFQITSYVSMAFPINTSGLREQSLTTAIPLGDTPNNNGVPIAGAGISGKVRIYNPSQSASVKHVEGESVHLTGGGILQKNVIGGVWNGGNGAVDGFQIVFKDGSGNPLNIASGVAKIFGIS